MGSHRVSLWRHIAAALLSVSVLTACDRLVDPPLPVDAQQFSPPAVYSTWWDMTRACSGLPGPLGAVTWFVSDEVLHDPKTGETLTAYWSAASNRIVINSLYVLEGSLVRHEMLHALIRNGGHPRRQFLGNCAGTVVCQGGCVEEAGPFPRPPENPITVTGDSLEITVSIQPIKPTTAHDGGFFAMTVFARNRTRHWVTADPGLSGSGITHSFFYNVSGPKGALIGGNNVASDPSDWIFAPGETKKAIFDFSIGNSLPEGKLPPGEYTVRGGYDEYWAPPAAVTIGP